MKVEQSVWSIVLIFDCPFQDELELNSIWVRSCGIAYWPFFVLYLDCHECSPLS